MNNISYSKDILWYLIYFTFCGCSVVLIFIPNGFWKIGQTPLAFGRKSWGHWHLPSTTFAYLGQITARLLGDGTGCGVGIWLGGFVDVPNGVISFCCRSLPIPTEEGALLPLLSFDVWEFGVGCGLLLSVIGELFP